MLKVRNTKKVKKVISKTPRKVKTASTSSTGHANSPETITITKKTKKADTPKTKTPKSAKVATPKNPKIETPTVEKPKMVTPKATTPKADTPKASKAEKASTPENQVLVASAKKSSEKRFPKRLSHVGTHAVLSKV